MATIVPVDNPVFLERASTCLELFAAFQAFPTCYLALSMCLSAESTNLSYLFSFAGSLLPSSFKSGFGLPFGSSSSFVVFKSSYANLFGCNWIASVPLKVKEYRTASITRNFMYFISLDVAFCIKNIN